MTNDSMGLGSLIRALLCGSAVVFGAAKAGADNGTWTTVASGNWSDATNWVSDIVASGAGSAASFTNGMAATVNQDVPGLTLGSLFFANGNHTITNTVITLDNIGSPATVTVGITNALTRAMLATPLNGTGGLTKQGVGTLMLLNTNTYSGATTVSGGTLKLSAAVSDIAGLSYRLDATALSSLTLSGTNVSVWADADGRAITFTQSTAALQPLYVPDMINGLPAIRFGDASTYRKLVSHKATTAQTVFIVYRMTKSGNAGGIWGYNGADVGIRASSDTQWHHWLNNGDFTFQSKMYIDGAEGKTFAAYQPHIVTAVSSNAVTWSTGLGDYYGSSGARYFWGEIGEVLAFDHTLSKDERELVENYLSGKWLGSRVHPVLDNLLPTATALCVSNAAVVDLNGLNQTVASLSGVGTLRNSNAEACTLTVGGDNTSTLFYGGLHGNLSLNKVGTGTLTLFGASTYSGSSTVQTGTLELSAWTLPSAGLSYRLDAADAATVTCSGSNVTAWADANGSALTFAQPDTALQPVYVTNAINGLPSIRLSQTDRNRMFANMATNVQTVFIVYQMRASGGADHIWGQSGQDYGIRGKSATEWFKALDPGDFTYQGQMFIDGKETSMFSANQPHIVMATRGTPAKLTTAIGDYWASSHLRWFRGDIGEILAYDRLLSTQERLAVESWLNRKWFGVGAEGLLPVTTAMTIAAGATLDLNGQVQMLSSLAGSGSIVNGTVTVSGQIIPGSDGTVGALTLPDAPKLTSTLRIDVRTDGTCDQLAVSGDLDVSQLALVIADIAQLNSASTYTLATCAGDLTGSLTSDNLPPKIWSVRYIRAPGAGKILLVPQNGLIIAIQ